MAAQTVSPPPAPPSAQVIGNAFVEQYYHILHYSPELVHRFYQDTSLLSRPDPNGLMTTVTTMKSINEQICSLDYKNYKAEIKTADAQDSFKNGVIVLVTGCLTGQDNLRRKFTQTFFLAPQDKGYYVLNDVFRYVEENGPDTSAMVDSGVHKTPSSSLEPNPEPDQVVDSPNVNHVSSQLHEVEIIEGVIDDQVIDGGQTVNDSDKLVEADPHVNENHVSVAAESLPTSSQEDAPKKSYASIVSSQTKKGPIKVYVPTNTAKLVPAKIENHPVSAAEPPAPESSSPVAPDSAPESKDTQDEVEGHSIYIRNLPLNITVSQLEAEFQKFGAIKPNGVQVRSNKVQEICFGFVEFQEFSSMQSAIKASPIPIGDRQAAVEVKRTTTRVGGGRGRFTPSRGGYHRSDSFRGRGNHNGGRTYVRSDSFRGRGNFSSGRGSGEGYQQARGRGGRRSSSIQNSVPT
ncbi:hypothetical protein C2S51_006232 [Perilla frutescens var. frutescens]|nr:hypothetical protein C2S51_006232 [Perilla frutescens var. frutescens]